MRDKISIPIQKRIFLHLVDYVNYLEELEVDNAITLQGIAKAINIKYEHISRSVKPLIDKGYLYSRSARVKENGRKKKAYFLTPEGIKNYRDIRKWFSNKLILIRTLENELYEINFYQLEKLLNYKVKPLDIYRYSSASKDGVIDLKQILQDKKDIDLAKEKKKRFNYFPQYS